VKENKKKKAAGTSVPKREQVDNAYKWRLDHIYSDKELWEKDYGTVKERLGEFSSYRGKLGDSPGMVKACLDLEEELGIIMGRLYVYACMKSHENTHLSEFQGLADRAGSLLVRFSTEISFIVPELSLMPEENLRSYSSDESLKEYSFFFQDIIRQKEHVLTPPEEKILAMAGELAQGPDDIFTLFTNADLKFPLIKDERGEKQQLTEERYQKFIKSTDRKVRKKAFKKLFDTYNDYQYSLSAMYSASIKADLFNARTRKYSSTLEAALDRNNIPVGVYDTVVDTVRNNLEPLHEYVEYRKRMLHVKKLHMYDLYVPLVEETQKDIPYSEALRTVRKSLEPLGEDYLGVFDRGISEGWVDVYENKGKKNGAYSWGSYGTHPYVLLNYNGTLRDVFTLAHEMGHAIHSWYSHSNQPYIYGDYTIFLAEVASTTNESLLLRYLLKNSDGRKDRMYLLNYMLEQIRTTVYRQTLFAEFERKVHRMVEEGEALTSEVLKAIWHRLNVDYYGSSIAVDDRIDIEWARIPHFYSSFYVYQYVTGFSAATCFTDRILSGGEEGRNRYLEFLKKGSSDYSINILKEAGVDMATSEPLETTVTRFRSALEEMKGQ
jgi:oligoendopeptidase F